MDPTPTWLPPPPRPVRRRSGVGCAVLIAVPFALIGVGLVVVLATRLWVEHGGTPVTVTVDGTTRSTSTGRHRSTTYAVQYHYDWAGRPVNDSQQVTGDEARRAVVGAQVPGRAWGVFGHPVCLADVGSVGRPTLGYAAFAGVWDGLLLLVVGAAWTAGRRQRRLVATGAAVTGHVTATYRGRKSTSILTVHYTYPGPAGPVQSKQLVGDTARGGSAVEVGRPVTVVYDPGRPARSVVYEWADYVVAS